MQITCGVCDKKIVAYLLEEIILYFKRMENYCVGIVYIKYLYWRP